jgi:hypothetical protein
VKNVKKKIFSFVLIIFVLLLFTACTPEGELLPEWKEPVSIFIQQLINVLVIPVLISGLAWIVGLVRAQWQKFSTINPEQAQVISFVINSVVLAAEQMNEAYPELIIDKRAWAIARAEDWINKLGLNLDVDQIADLIEAEVKALFNTPDKLPEEP